MARATALPIISAESGLSRYLEEIRRFPMLEPQEEYMLAKSWREHGDRDAAHRLVTSHLRLVAKIAMGYRGYGLPISEVISEGNVGLMQAVKRFEPDKGFRLATYAMWWIKAAIQEYILRSWSLVKMGTTANQKKLFFNLRKAKSKISALEEGDLRPDQVKLIECRNLALGLAQVEKELLLIGGGAHLHQRPRAQDVFLDRRLDPPHGVGGEPEAFIRLKALDRLHQPDIALGNHLGNGQAVAAVAHGDFRHQAQMAGDQFVRCITIAVLAPALGQNEFVLRFQHREPPDLLEIASQAVFGL